jgi:integrase
VPGFQDPAARSTPHLGKRSRYSLACIPKVVHERLGHASVSITLDVYSHVAEGLHGDAASRVARIIFGPVRSSLASKAMRR